MSLPSNRGPRPLENLPFPYRISGEGPPIFTPVDIGENETWAIANECPMAFVFNRRNYAVMMGTPEDLVDFAIGFAMTERVITAISEVIDLDIRASDRGVDIRFKISPEALERLDITQRRRTLIGSASCGLCGLDNAETLFTILPKVAAAPITLSDAAIASALTTLDQYQPINAQTRTHHAAAWADHNGAIQMAREDVGRHNALDKLLGALALSGADMSAGFVVMSSRCSYEIVEKAARSGVQALISLSAPTGFALRKAQEAGLSLYARNGGAQSKACVRLT